MIVEMPQLVRTMGEHYKPILALICNFLELAPEYTRAIEEKQAVVSCRVSDEELSKRIHGAEGMNGEGLHRNPHVRLYITGKVIAQSKCCIFNILIIRPSTSLRNGNLQISISQLFQTCHFRVCNWGEEGFVAGKRVVREMEAIVIG